MLLPYSPEQSFVKNKSLRPHEAPKPTSVNKNVIPSKRNVKLVTYQTSTNKRCAVKSVRDSRTQHQRQSNNNEDSLTNLSSGTRRILRSNVSGKSDSVSSLINADENTNFSTINIISYDGNRKVNLTAFIKKRDQAIEYKNSMFRQVAQVSKEVSFNFFWDAVPYCALRNGARHKKFRPKILTT